MRFVSVFRSVVACFIVLFSLVQAHGQRSAPVDRAAVTTKAAPGRAKMMCNNDAGEVAGFTGFNLMSNSFGDNPASTDVVAFGQRPDTIFLCYQDAFTVDHAADTEDISGDPVQATVGGVGFLLYECQPTVTGTSFNDINADPCILDSGLAPFDAFSVAVSANFRSEDYDLVVANDGDNVTTPTIPALFPGPNGEPTPVVITFAPITFDSLNPTNGRATFEMVTDEDTGEVIVPECINVRPDQSFSVAFLNEVTVVNLNASPGSCDGSFDIRGGVSELRGSGDYTITVTNTVTGEVAALEQPTQSYRHNDEVRYRVPTAGTYRIDVEDGVSCQLQSVTVTHPAGCSAPVGLAIECAVGGPGEQVCIPIRTTNFTDISAFNFAIQFDPALLTYDAAASPVRATAISGGTLNATLNGTNEVRVTYENAGNPVSIADGADFIELCFNVVGTLGSDGPLTFTGASSATIESGGSVEEQNPLTTTDCTFSVRSDELAFTTEQNNVDCPGDADGSITVTVFGGTEPYMVSYVRTIPPPNVIGPTQNVATEGGQTAFTSLIAGFYDITVTDAAGGQVTREVQITEGVSFSANIEVVQPPTCNGFSDGILTVVVSENAVAVDDPTAAGYTIQWSTGATQDTIQGLADGSYSVTVTQTASGCTREDNGNLDEPNVLFIDVAQSEVDDATCQGAGDGVIRVRAVGGVQDANGAYTFNWSDGFSEQSPESNRTNLEPGDYRVTVVDVNGCSNERPFTVGADKVLRINSVVDQIDCFGDGNGSIAVSGSVVSGNPLLPYEVSLENLDPNAGPPTPFQPVVNSNPVVFDNLGPATYVVALRDQDPQGCVTRDTITITEPELLEIGTLDPVNAGCPDVLGSLDVPVTGGTQPYEFRFVNDSLPTPLDSITEMNAARLADLQPDTNYLVIVTDANGCIDSARFEILAPAGPTLSPIVTSTVSCPGDANGQLTVTAEPPPGETITGYTWYRVNADGSLGSPVANEATTQANLAVGFYAVEVFSSNQCSTLDFGAVESPTPVFLDDFTLNDPTCLGDANGSIFVTPGGGTPNANDTYNYVWSTDPNGAPTQNSALTNLRAGTYGVTISDANNCQPFFDTTFVLMDPPAITGAFQITDVSCPDDATADGAATFLAEYSDGTQGTFDFSWSTGDTDMAVSESTVTGLTRGPLTLEVSDLQCIATFRDTVGSPDEFLITVQTADVSCNGLADGTAMIDVTGGTADYTFSYVGLTDVDNTVDNLGAGSYQFSLTDANGCSPGARSFEIEQPDPLVLEVDPVLTTDDVTCAGDTDGVISVFISSTNNNPLGDSPYAWSANVGDNDDATATQLAPGTYGVTVTDVEGCQDSLSYTVGEPESITFTVQPIQPPACFGETTPILLDTAFGGQSMNLSDFTFSVNNDGFRISAGESGSAFAGDITVVVFDTVGCSAEQVFNVSQPPQIVVDLPESITIELGDSLTQLNPLVSPAGDVYRYLWTPGDFLSSDTVRNPTIFPFDSRDYTLIVTNQNNCQAFADIFVEVDANRNVFIPNAFSPNRDGRNEDFRIFACQGVERVNTVRIFDRWGGLVYEADNLDPNCLDGIQLWDGVGKNGKRVSPGVFVYMVEVAFLDEVKLLYRGGVTVVR